MGLGTELVKTISAPILLELRDIWPGRYSIAWLDL